MNRLAWGINRRPWFWCGWLVMGAINDLGDGFRALAHHQNGVAVLAFVGFGIASSTAFLLRSWGRVQDRTDRTKDAIFRYTMGLLDPEDEAQIGKIVAESKAEGALAS